MKEHIAHTRNMEMILRARGDYELSVSGWPGVLKIAERAHQDIASHCGIPAGYYKRMLSQGPQLLADSVDYWLHREPTFRLLLIEGDELRRMLSPKRAGGVEKQSTGSQAQPSRR